MKPCIIVMVGVMVAWSVTVPSIQAGFIGSDTSQGPPQRLRAIFAAYWDDELRTDPLEATFIGDHRSDDRLGDPSEAAYLARLGRDREHRAALEGIDPAASRPTSGSTARC